MLGAPPEAVYNDSFACFDGSRATSPLPTRAINDGFCDCVDGSDEPGTAACATGRFYCNNLGYRPRFVASAMVADGICDCCDGSDERERGRCPDTCEEEATKAAARERTNRATRRAGALVRKSLPPTAAKVRGKLKKEFAADHGKMSDMLNAMQQMQDILQEAKADPATMKKAQMQFYQLRSQGLPEVQQKLARSQMLLETPLGDLVALEGDCTLSPILSDNLIRGGTTVYVAKHYSFMICPFEYVMQVWEGRFSWEYHTCLAERGDIDAITGANNSLPCMEKAKSAGEDPEEIKAHTDFCAKQPPAKVGACNKEFQRRRKFAKEQDQKTFLGLFNYSKSNITKHWVYEDGSGELCGNGQPRRVNVTLSCGPGGGPGPASRDPGRKDTKSKGKILTTAENGMCNYEFHLQTPAACTAEDHALLQRPPPGITGASGAVAGSAATTDGATSGSSAAERIKDTLSALHQALF